MKDNNRALAVDDLRMRTVYYAAVLGCRDTGAHVDLMVRGVESDLMLLKSASGADMGVSFYHQDLLAKGLEPAHLKGAFDIATSSGTASATVTTSDVGHVLATVQKFLKP
jgi:hypothetical protein